MQFSHDWDGDMTRVQFVSCIITSGIVFGAQAFANALPEPCQPPQRDKAELEPEPLSKLTPQCSCRRQHITCAAIGTVEIHIVRAYTSSPIIHMTYSFAPRAR